VDTMKNKDLKPYRLALLKKQGYVCPLCELELLPEDAALDHCHTTGHVRQVLHRSCNSAEGKILHWLDSVAREMIRLSSSVTY